jgi:hypothetical protein
MSKEWHRCVAYGEFDKLDYEAAGRDRRFRLCLQDAIRVFWHSCTVCDM